jgi:hypothetical protein
VVLPYRFLFALIAWLSAFPAIAAVDFDRDVRPILSDNCFACHGPDDKARMANLRLDTRDGLFANQVIVPGGSARSKLYQKISAADRNRRMPPAAFGRTLTSKQVETIKEWIDQGAKWELHWSYVPPKRPEPPAVKEAGWVRNSIDAFILARLEKEGLTPSPEAGKVTLLRRVTFDLTGLPPTPAEADAFAADKSADAYEKVVDGLLASPRYGERMAMQWLDLARYADTHGYHIDSAREMWHWRDWVIQAFNRNLPFDEFTIEQLAGDLLPHATLEQKIATGFNRNHMVNFEGGAIPEEYHVEYVADRVETTAAVWLGLTMGCARCHDHKYDPISQKDFYRFFAFFNTVEEKGLDGRKGNAKPMLQLPSAQQKAELDELETAIPAKQKILDSSETAALQKHWEETRLSTLPEAPRNGLLAHYELDGSFADSSGHYAYGRTLSGDPTFGDGMVGKSVDFDGDTHVTLGNVADFDRGDPFTLSTWIRSNNGKEQSLLQKVANPPGRRGWELLFEQGRLVPIQKRAARLVLRLMHQWPDDAIAVRTKPELMVGQWSHVSISYDGSGKAAGLRLYVDGKAQEFEVLQDSLTGGMCAGAPLEIGNKELGKPYKGRLDDLRIYNRVLEPAEVEHIALQHPVRVILEGVTGKRTKEQDKQLREYFLTYDAPEQLLRTYKDLKALEKRKESLEEAIPNTMVMAEMEKPRDTFVLGRGDYRTKLEKVTPGVPPVLPPLPKGAAPDRLALARWLVDPAHPLTARVVVNRYWQMYFGIGLVKTPQDFGSQGDPPSHPELLDWLATEFVRTHWDVKAMQRLIVTSAAYRQSSRETPELLEKDPENRLLAHGPRFRLPAEMVRDNALAVSGLLNPAIGGASVFPYQPKGMWEEMAFGEGFSAQTYTPSHAGDLYRRSMYTFWKRTVPPPSLATFDAPDREKCTARRSVTNTPLQALVLLNDPTYVEAARALAQRTLLEAPKDPSRRIAYVFRLATDRKPAPPEVKVLRDLARAETLHYRHDTDAAEKLLRVGESSYNARLDPGELAAWTTVASTILNLDETITKE